MSAILRSRTAGVAVPGASGPLAARRRAGLLSIGGLLVVLAGSMVVAAGLGPVTLPPSTTVEVLLHHLLGTGSGDRVANLIVWKIRVPRVLTGMVVGAGLAVAGAVVQAFLRNPVADPFVLGLSSGASVGAVVVLVTGASILGTFTLPVVAFAGAMATVLVVFMLARDRGRLEPFRLILVGIAAAQLLSGVTSFLLLRSQDADAQQQVLFWLLGSLAGAQWRLLAIPGAVVAAAVVLLVIRAVRLNVLALGDEVAASLGVNASRMRTELLVLTSLLTGAVVAISGSIGFVGLVVPHLARLLVGPDHRRMVPVAALLGAIVLVWADTAARLALAPDELPIGILTAALGVPFFVALLRTRGRSLEGVAG